MTDKKSRIGVFFALVRMSYSRVLGDGRHSWLMVAVLSLALAAPVFAKFSFREEREAVIEFVLGTQLLHAIWYCAAYIPLLHREESRSGLLSLEALRCPHDYARAFCRHAGFYLAALPVQFGCALAGLIALASVEAEHSHHGSLFHRPALLLIVFLPAVSLLWGVVSGGRGGSFAKSFSRFLFWGLVCTAWIPSAFTADGIPSVINLEGWLKLFQFSLSISAYTGMLLSLSLLSCFLLGSRAGAVLLFVLFLAGGILPESTDGFLRALSGLTPDLNRFLHIRPEMDNLLYSLAWQIGCVLLTVALLQKYPAGRGE